MSTNTLDRAFCGVVVLISWVCSCSAQAPAGALTSYPARSVRIVVGYAAGGGTDIMARYFAQKFGEAMRQSFLVENRPGAGGNIGTDLVAKAPADGYTLLMAGAGHAINVGLYPKLSYDPIKDFAAVGMVASSCNIIAAHPSLPVASLRQLISMAKARPEQITYASAGSGTPQHLAVELFRAMAGIKLVHVPYGGGAPSLTAVLGGQVSLISGSIPIALPYVRTGKLKALGVTSADRSSLASDLPTVAEAAGLPGYEANNWYALLAPAGTPAVIINKLSAEIERLEQTKEVRDRLATLGFDPFYNNPAQTTQVISSDIVKWTKVIRESSVKAD